MNSFCFNTVGKFHGRSNNTLTECWEDTGLKELDTVKESQNSLFHMFCTSPM